MESITKLNKFREFSKSSYKEIKSKCCWYCHKRVQEELSYWKSEFSVKSGTDRGRLYTRLWWSYAGQRIAGFYYRKCLRDCHRFCEFEAGIKKSAGGQICCLKFC